MKSFDPYVMPLTDASYIAYAEDIVSALRKVARAASAFYIIGAVCLSMCRCCVHARAHVHVGACMLHAWARGQMRVCGQGCRCAWVGGCVHAECVCGQVCRCGGVLCESKSGTAAGSSCLTDGASDLSSDVHLGLAGNTSGYPFV